MMNWKARNNYTATTNGVIIMHKSKNSLKNAATYFQKKVVLTKEKQT